MSGSIQTIVLHTEAPPKPAIGEPCNGCGVCCTAETCPVGIVLFLQRSGACPALVWKEEDKRYFCGVVNNPAHYLRWLPRRWNAFVSHFFARRIAAGKGCDCSAEVFSPVASAPSDKTQS